MRALINGVELTLETSPELFSPSAPDIGTLAMLDSAEISSSDRVLDLGCGCGVVGIYCAKKFGCEVTMCDVLPRAAEISQKNAEKNGVCAKVFVSDGYDGLPDGKFTLILSNPPYHTDFSVAKRFVEGGFERLELGGRMMMVTKRRQWYENKLRAVFGGVKVREKDGYFVFTAEKRSDRPPKKENRRGGMSKKLRRKRGST